MLTPSAYSTHRRSGAQPSRMTCYDRLTPAAASLAVSMAVARRSGDAAARRIPPPLSSSGGGHDCLAITIKYKSKPKLNIK